MAISLTIVLWIVISSQITLPYFTTFISHTSLKIVQNASAAALPDFNFAALGDWGCTNDTSHTIDNIMSKRTELTLGLGDYSYVSTADCWFSMISQIDNQTKIAIGDRDYDYPGKLEQVMNHFQLTKQFYSFNYQNVHFIVMSTETSFDETSEQYKFVEDDLAAAASNPVIEWIVISFHKPMYLSTPFSSVHTALVAFRNTYNSLFDRYSVDLVLQGDKHAYERMFPLEYNSADPAEPLVRDRTNRSSYNDPQGAIYVIVGTGGQSLNTFQNKTSFSVTQFSTFGFLNIEMINNGSTMRATFYGNDGTIGDQFTIVKSTWPNNKLPIAELTTSPTTIFEGQTSYLDASSSFDPDSDSLTYVFRQTAGTQGTITVQAQSPSKATFRAPSVTANETATIELTVDDGKGGVKTATIDIAVMNTSVEIEGCNCVIFRLDDVDDYYSDPKIAVMDQFIAKNQDLALAIVLNHFGEDPSVVDKVEEGYQKGLFELTVHGWDHVEFAKYGFEQQKTWLENSNAKLQDMFGTTSNIFIPPYGSYNTDTLIAMSQSAQPYNVFSVEKGVDHYPQFVADGSEIRDEYGIYHLPYSAKFFDYNTSVGVKVPIDKVLSDIDAGIDKYGYAVVTMHPQDFGIKVDGKLTKEVDQSQIDDLNYIIDTEIAKRRSITTFSKLIGLEIPSFVDNIAPSITAPADIGAVQTSILTKVSLGTPIVRDNAVTMPIVTNDAPADGFPLGNTIVTWTATDASGNTATTTQYVTIAQTSDTTLPLVSITSPRNGSMIAGPFTGVLVTVSGKASDVGSGIKLIELKTGSLPFEIVTPRAPNDWSSWQKNVTIEDQGTVYLQAKAIDYFGNVRWSSRIPITITFEDSSKVSSGGNEFPSLTPSVTGGILGDLMLIIIPVVAIPSLAAYIVWRQRAQKKRK